VSAQRTPEAKAARRCGARVTVWRAIHEAYVSGGHVTVRWFNHTYEGHIGEVGKDGFRIRMDFVDAGPEDHWCSWKDVTKAELCPGCATSTSA
jgi:hypothetical protein